MAMEMAMVMVMVMMVMVLVVAFVVEYLSDPAKSTRLRMPLVLCPLVSL